MQLIYSGAQKELFYTDSRCKQAYKNYVNMLLQRTNTYTGVQYKNDPTIFSFELMVRTGPGLFLVDVDCLTWNTTSFYHDIYGLVKAAAGMWDISCNEAHKWQAAASNFDVADDSQPLHCRMSPTQQTCMRSTGECSQASLYGIGSMRWQPMSRALMGTTW